MSNDLDEMHGFLAKCEAKRDALNQLIESLRLFLGLEAGELVAPGGTPAGLPREITSTTFWNKKIPDAARLYLQMVKKPQTTQQVADALVRGGMTTKATDFPATVMALLRRHENQTDDVIRIPSGEWALPEWYPDRPRKRKPSKGKSENGTADAPEAEAATDAADGKKMEKAEKAEKPKKADKPAVTPTSDAPSPSAPEQP
jgi:hypothetical protein